MSLFRWLFLFSCLAPVLVSCDNNGGASVDHEDASEPSYYADVKEILDSNCVACHRSGEFAPFALDTYASAHEARAAVTSAVASGTMPPWKPSDDCNSYLNHRGLEAEDKETLLAWSGGQAAEGDPADAPPDPDFGVTPYDISIELPEAYTPQSVPDDYRCMIVEWPEEEPTYVTGFRVAPDQREIVHHVIAFLASPSIADDYRALDAEDELVGYPCFGGPGGDQSSLVSGMRWLASWAPGGGDRSFRSGTGIPVEPGSVLIVQMHYNTLEAEPVADRSVIEFAISDEVERPAVVMPFTNPMWVMGVDPMSIPAGEADVVHRTSRDMSNNALSFLASDIGLSNGDSFEIHMASHHMHTLGTYGRSWIERADGSEVCLVEIEDWDFNWQDGYQLVDSVRVDPGDRLHLECHWDNTAENQPVVDGEALPPRNVEWGDGTTDEMCLGVYYITGL